MIRSDGQRIVRRVADGGGSLRTREADAQPVEARDERGGRTRARRTLLDLLGAGGHIHDRARIAFRFALLASAFGR